MRCSVVLKVLVFSATCALALGVSPMLLEYAEKNREFSAAVFQETAKDHTGNFLVCPLSVALVMSMVGFGAVNDTYLEIGRALRLPTDYRSTESIFMELGTHLQGTERYSLNVANRIYVKQNYIVSPTYQSVIDRIYSATAENVDFVQNVHTANLINAWVEQKTNNKIHNLVNPDDFSYLTNLILVNAMYFKGNWVKPFDFYDTTRKPFYSATGEQSTVDMMFTVDSFNYYESPELDCKFLRMPYEGRDVSMLLVLPNKKDGLPALEQRAFDVFKMQNFTKQNVKVQIPKFSMETSIEFKPILQRMGVLKAFTPDAELSGIGIGKIYVDKVVQKTFINVTEKGSEAAAATSGGVVTLSIPAPLGPVKMEFTADHPFLMALQFTPKTRARKPPVILFVGRYTGPDSQRLIFD